MEIDKRNLILAIPAVIVIGLFSRAVFPESASLWAFALGCGYGILFPIVKIKGN